MSPRFEGRWDTQAKYERNVRDYYRLLTAADRNVGRVLESLQRTGRAENTVVIFMGDNGYYKGDRGFAGKWSHFEESLRVPLVIFDPREIGQEKDRLCAAITLNLDIAPTLLDLAGVEIPKDYQGMSLVPLTEMPDAPWPRDAFACEHLMKNPSIPKWEGIRTRRFTYAKYFEQDPPFEFLHDRKQDPDQRRNVVDDEEYAEDLARLRERSGQMIAEYERSRIAPAPPVNDAP